LIALYPEDQDTCFDILTGEIEVIPKIKKKDIITSNRELMITSIPFDSQKICDYFYEKLSSDSHFMDIWNSKRLLMGFLALLALNDIGLPEDIENLLFKKLFEDQFEDIEPSSMIRFSRFQLDNWEEEFKKIKQKLNENDIYAKFTIFRRKDELSQFNKILSLLNGKYLIHFRSHRTFNSSINIKDKIIEAIDSSNISAELYKIFEEIKAHIKDKYHFII